MLCNSYNSIYTIRCSPSGTLCVNINIGDAMYFRTAIPVITRASVVYTKVYIDKEVTMLARVLTVRSCRNM